MEVRPMVLASATVLLLLTQGSALTQSQAQYAQEKSKDWQAAEAAMNEAYAILLKQAEQESNQEPAEQLKKAKQRWEEFRDSFCSSVSTTYGGMWSGVHHAECRAQLAGEFRTAMSRYGW